MQVRFADFRAQCRYYLYTWIPRVWLLGVDTEAPTRKLENGRFSVIRLCKVLVSTVGFRVLEGYVGEVGVVYALGVKVSGWKLMVIGGVPIRIEKCVCQPM